MLEILAKRTIKKMRYYNNDDKMDCYQSGLLDMFSNVAVILAAAKI